MRLLILALVSTALAIGWRDDDLAKELTRIKPIEPAEASKSFRLREGFTLNLAASEPLVSDPVSACYDADGRLFVVEMRGYPYPENSPTGRVRRLEDTDGDGVFEKSTVFLDGLSWPTSVVPYKRGVFVAVPPKIVYAEDADGDGVAESQKVMFTGFGTQNVQALVNGLIWGPDGWIYGVSGGNGGDIVNESKPESPAVSVRGRDFRFRPDGSEFEAISGGGQFGHAFDDWGHRFTCNNSNHIRQIVLPSRYLERNKSLIVADVIADIAIEGPAAPVFRISEPEPWRIVRTRQRVADPALLAKLPPTERFAFGFFTSATGVTIYRGSAFPTEFQGNAFIGDVGGNLVHRKILTKGDGVFSASRAEPDRKSEFLASSDTWFRPVNFTNTPSGTLLVLDMYRETIEHPLSIPEPIKKHLDLTSGRDRGRIYEIVPDRFARRPPPRLSKASTAELVDHLADPDAWWRETAQRLLLERRDPATVRLLTAMEIRRPNGLARIHALWTLDALGELRVDSVLSAMSDADPNVREQAVRLTEGRFGLGHRLADRLAMIAADSDPMVRFQAALSLGDCREAEATSALARAAEEGRSSPWVRAAVLSSLAGRLPEFLRVYLGRADTLTDEGGRVLLDEVSALAGAEGSIESIGSIVAFSAKTGEGTRGRRAALIGLDRGLGRSGRSIRSLKEIPEAIFDSARDDAVSQTLGIADRVMAVKVVGLGPVDVAIAILPGLLDPRSPTEIQFAAIQALNTLPDPRIGSEVASRWNALSPSVRREAAEVLLSRPDRVNAMLDAIESGALPANGLEPARRAQILAHTDAQIRDRAKRLLAEVPKPDRAKVIDAMRPALRLDGDRGKGRSIFTKVCAACHKAEGQGEMVGPELATILGRSPEDLLVHILDPNREVPPAYLDYRVALIDGRIVTGMIASEAANAVTLKRAGGVVEVVPRDRIEAIISSGVSVMPEGLEAGLSPGDFADLLAFLRGLK